MRSSTVVALLAGSAAAQSTVSSTARIGTAQGQSSAVLLNPLPVSAATFTVIGSSSGTTTYVNSCSEGAGIPASYLSTANAASGSAAASASSAVHTATGDLVMTPISAPSTTAAARLRRQDDSLFGDMCEPITIKQGSSSMEMHMQDPAEGAWTVDMNCAWKGEMTSADLTCTATQNGSFAKILEAEGVSSETLAASDVAVALQTVAVVQSASGSGSAAASGSHSGSPSATASGSGAPAATGSGAAAGAPLSKGVMAFVGGAAGVFAAALAL